MNENILIEEQEQSKHIIKHWCKDQARWLLFGSAMIGLVMGSLDTLVSPKHILPKLCLTAFGMLCLTLSILHLHSRSRCFARNLSDKERRLLTEAAAKGYKDQHPFIRILLEKADFSYRIELLRPSQETDDNTLLRATTHTDDTAQEQLLRPTENNTA